jgi:hypothetical protein
MRVGPPAAIAHDQARLVGTTLPHPEAALTAGQAEGTVHVDVVSADNLGEAQADTKPHTRRHLRSAPEVTVRSAKDGRLVPRSRQPFNLSKRDLSRAILQRALAS